MGAPDETEIGPVTTLTIAACGDDAVEIARLLLKANEDAGEAERAAFWREVIDKIERRNAHRHRH